MTNPDFSTLTGPALVEAYNEMILTATDLGMPAEVWRTVKRFSGLDAGRTRCEKLHRAISQVREQDAAAPDEDRPRTSPKPEEMADTRAAATEVSADANRDLRPLHLVTTTELKTNAAAHEAANTPDAPPAESGDNMSEDDDMAKKRRAAKAAKPKAARKVGGYGPDTVWGLRDAYNELVPAALKLGIKCRLLGLKAKKENPERYPNGTAFATKDAGLAAIKRLQAAITKAKK